MTGVSPAGYDSGDQTGWDRALHRMGGDLLQSWAWGEFKQRHGWAVARVQLRRPGGEAMAQLLFRRRGPLTVAYLPRGSVIAGEAAVAADLLAAIDDACARHRAVVLVVEPDESLPRAWSDTGRHFVGGPESFQTARTVEVPLLGDAELLTQMRKDTRYNIHYAQRRGVAVERVPVSAATIDTFFRLLQETARRHGFGIHTRAYYEDFLRLFAGQAVLFFAVADGTVTAALIAARCGDKARSMYAGSAVDLRARGDAALLRFEAMRWARERGCRRYDLGGIAPETPSTASGRSHGSNLDGVHQFKVGFGGEIVAYPPTVERRYHPALAWIVRRVHPQFRPAPRMDRSQCRAVSP